MKEVKNAFYRSEKIIKLLWYNLHLSEATTIDGKVVKVIFRGVYNLSNGPDFVNAKVLVDGKEIVGDVETHIYASDWYKHKHHLDSRYNNVILQVVMNNDLDENFVFTANGRAVFQIYVPESVLAGNYLLRYDDFVFDQKLSKEIPVGICYERINSGTISIDYIKKLLMKMGKIRFNLKAVKFIKKAKVLPFTEAFYSNLLESLGYQNNRRQFSELAKSLPLEMIKRVEYLVDEPQSLEYLLLSAGGFIKDSEVLMLVDEEVKEYINRIKNFAKRLNYSFPLISWNYKGVYPLGFPERRLAGIVPLIRELLRGDFFEKAIKFIDTDERNTEKIVKGFEDFAFRSFQPHYISFWHYHCKLNTPKLKRRNALIGADVIKTISYNVILPALYAWVKINYKRDLKKVGLTQKIKVIADNFPMLPLNSISKVVIKRMFSVNFPREIPRKEMYQQGLLHIFNNYCFNYPEGCSVCPVVSELNSL